MSYIYKIIERDEYTEERYIDMFGRSFMSRTYKSGAMVITWADCIRMALRLWVGLVK